MNIIYRAETSQTTDFTNHVDHDFNLELTKKSGTLVTDQTVLHIGDALKLRMTGTGNFDTEVEREIEMVSINRFILQLFFVENTHGIFASGYLNNKTVTTKRIF